MQYRQDIVTRMLIIRVELITISIVTIRSIWQNSAAFFLRFEKFPPHICESCGGTYRRNYVVKHVHSSNRWRNKQRQNPCVTGDAILPQTRDQKMRSGIWLFAVSPSDTE